MTAKEIQRVLQTLHRESLEQTLIIGDRKTESELRAIFAALEPFGLKHDKLGGATVTLARFSFDEQDQIERYAQRLISEAHDMCLRLQEQCPVLGEGETDLDELYVVERWYRAQLYAMKRLRRRRDTGNWIHTHIIKARLWLEKASAEAVN